MRWLCIILCVGMMSWSVWGDEVVKEDVEFPVYRPGDEARAFLGVDAFGAKARGFYTLRADEEKGGGYREVMYIRYDVDPNGVREFSNALKERYRFNAGRYDGDLAKRLREKSKVVWPRWWTIDKAVGDGDDFWDVEGMYVTKTANVRIRMFCMWRDEGTVRVFIKAMKIRRVDSIEEIRRRLGYDVYEGEYSRYYYYMVWGDMFWFRLDMRKEDMIAFLARNKRLPNYEQLKENEAIKRDMERACLKDKEWLRVGELEGAVFGAYENYATQGGRWKKVNFVAVGQHEEGVYSVYVWDYYAVPKRDEKARGEVFW